MKRVRLIAQARFKHDGRSVYRGVEFTATEREAEELCALRFATRVVEAEESPPEVKVERVAPPKQQGSRYSRRDLRAVR